MIKSINDNQQEILKNISELHLDGAGYQCDATYGNGSFWKGLEKPIFKYDIDPQHDYVIKACNTSLPLPDNFLYNIVLDPPFLTYIKQGREHNSIMGKRFSGYWRYEELAEHYITSLTEANRVLQKGGVLVFKCQDIIHNHKMHCTHTNVIGWAEDTGFRLKDLFILTAKHRMPAGGNKGKRTQKHARIHHSYFLVFTKLGDL